jgi:hypothetical protein
VSRLEAQRPSKLGGIDRPRISKRSAPEKHARRARVKVGHVHLRDDVHHEVTTDDARRVLERGGENAERRRHVEVAVVFARQKALAHDDEVRLVRTERHDAKRLRVVRRWRKARNVADAFPDSVVQRTSGARYGGSRRSDRNTRAATGFIGIGKTAVAAR